ncbi:MAG: AtpZ/AtpI family protein [Armatimonadetes bacterium]|nr:AtpZ/AtpI family protein [Anaerolineae bacterium]
MTHNPPPQRTPITPRVKNLALAAVAAQAGCVTLVIVLAALFIGLGLDSQLGRRGPFTFSLLIVSIPVSLYVMLRVTLAALNRLQAQPVRKPRRPAPKLEEE